MGYIQRQRSSRRLLLIAAIGFLCVFLEIGYYNGAFLYYPTIYGAGDSLMSESGVLDRVTAKFSKTGAGRWNAVNFARPGSRAAIEVLEDERASHFWFRLPWKHHEIVWVISGTNDLGNSNGGDAAVKELLSNVKEYFVSRHEAGFSEDECFYSALLPRAEPTDLTFEADRQAFNKQIQSQLSGLAHVISYDNDPRLQNPNDVSIYWDGLHLTKIGNEIVADRAFSVISEYVK